MKNKIKILIIVIFSCTAIFITTSFITTFINNRIDVDYTYKIENITDTKLTLKAGKLYNGNNDSIVSLGESNIYDYYKAIELYEYTNYYFVIFSRNVSEFDDKVIIECGKKNFDTFISIINKETGLGNILSLFSITNTQILNMDSIMFIDKNTFLISCNDLIMKNPLALYIITITPSTNSLRFFDYKLTFPNYIEKFVYSDGKFLVLLTDKQLLEVKVTMDAEKLIAGSLTTNISNDYQEQKYFLDGYFANYENQLIYLDNELMIRNYNTNQIIEKLTNLDDFWLKYK